MRIKINTYNFISYFFTHFGLYKFYVILNSIKPSLLNAHIALVYFIVACNNIFLIEIPKNKLDNFGFPFSIVMF